MGIGRILFACMVMGLLFLFIKCSAPDTGRNRDRLVLSLGENPETLDPHKASLGVESDVLIHIGASLLDYGPDLKFHPYLAEAYHVSDDGKVWYFKIRQGITHHDGTPFNARTYKKNLERAMAPETASPIAGSYLTPVERIETPTDYELIFHLKTPFLPFPFYLADAAYLQPISEKALQKYGADYGQHPVSVGPFKFKKWRSGQEIVLEKNENFAWTLPYYQNRGAMKFKELAFKIVPERVTTVAALETGKIDIAGIPVEERNRFVREGRFKLFEQLHSGVSLYLVMNLSRSPFDDVRVRRAINHAINKQDVIDAALDGWAIPAYGPAAPLIWGYSPTVEKMGYEYDPSRARTLLREAGWKDTDGDGILDRENNPFELDFWTQPIESWMLAAEALQAQFREVGIKVNINSFELGTLLESMTQGNHDLSLMGYTWTADCDILYFYYHSSQIGSGPNYSQCSLPELDDLLIKARQSPNEEIGYDYYRQVQEYIVREALIAPIYIAKSMSAVNPRVQNIRQHPAGFWLLGDVFLQPPLAEN
ncbi:MAG: ABC transporter substrate-binding protein [Calditrichia bacterium]